MAPIELVGFVRRWIGEVEELRQENEKLKATGQPERNLLIGVEETDAETIMKQASSSRVRAKETPGWQRTRRRLANSPKPRVSQSAGL